MEKTNISDLIRKALQARENAYAPYSGFHVGAALLCDDGTVYTGCNVENASYPAGNCAERTAVFKAVSEGKISFSAICIVGGPKDGECDFCPPCGICRQVLSEFCNTETFPVILAKNQEEYHVYMLEKLLPLSFGKMQLVREPESQENTDGQIREPESQENTDGQIRELDGSGKQQ